VPPQNKTKKTKAKDTSDANNDTSSSNDTSPANSTEETAKQQPEKVQKKRSIPYNLNRIERTVYGPASLTKE
jgi:hypothetical protein